MNCVRKLLLVTAVLGVASVAQAGELSVELDFYTPMAQWVESGRDYLITSNSYIPIDEGEGLQSYETLTFLKMSLAAIPGPDGRPGHVAYARLNMDAWDCTNDPGMVNWDRPVPVSVHNCTADAADLYNGVYTPKQFQGEWPWGDDPGYIDNTPIDVNTIFEGKIYTYDITDLVDDWVSYVDSGGAEGLANYGISLTGRTDPQDPQNPDNQHPHFWSTRVYPEDGEAPDVKYTFYVGNASLDDYVDDNDLGLLLANWDRTGVTWTEGDFNGDGHVSDIDLSLLLANWSEGVPLNGSSIPEPATMTFLAVGAIGAMLRRRMSKAA